MENHDRRLVFCAAFLRATATGLVGVALGLHLAERGLSAGTIGAVVSAGLLGNAVAALVTTLAADRAGRRRFLVAVAVLSAAGAASVLLVTSPSLLAAAAFLGLVNGMGRDRGPGLIVEQAILPATTDDAGRTRVYAWYNVLQDAGHALGSLLAGIPSLAHAGARGPSAVAPLAIAAALFAGVAIVSASLGRGVEARSLRAPWHATPRTRGLLLRISALFTLDSLGGGFLTTSLLTYFFFERFGAGAGAIAVMFSGARVLNAISHLAAARLARRFGLVNTMVFTHVPSSLLLVTAAFAPTFPIAAGLFLLREGLVEMDVPTRQSYVAAVVLPEERTLAAGVTHLVRMAAWAVAPAFAGLLMETRLAAPLVIGAGLKILYDFLLYRAFRGVRPPEEGA
ncbi:MAG: MFS transporter [bacterium]